MEENKKKESKAAAKTLSDFFAKRPTWKNGALTGARRLLYVAVPTFIWAVLTRLDVMASGLSESITLLLSVCLFILSIPLGLILRADDLIAWGMSFSPEFALIVSLFIVAINFIIIGAIVGLLKPTK